jgi:hypothetical protein
MWTFLLAMACAPAPSLPTPNVIHDVPGSDPAGGETPGAGDTGPVWVDPATPPAEDPAAPGLVINEAMPENTCSFSFEPGELPDWVEIYNPTPVSVDLSRVSLWDGSGIVWMGPAGETIEPGAFALVFADGGEDGMHAPFSLDKDGDTLTLGVDGEVVDRINMGALGADIAWARFPDGGAWGLTVLASPGDTNGTTPSETLDPVEALYTLDTIDRVEITLDSAAYNSLTSNSHAYVDATFSIGGIAYEPVGARLRGSMTFQPLTGKAAWKIDMNRFLDFRYRGQEKFNILNMYYDASMVREYMAYDVFRSFGVPAARNKYVLTYLNEQPLGVEMLSEAYDDEFLRNWYGDGDGYMLWEEGSTDCEEGPCDSTIVTNMLAKLTENRTAATDADIAELETMLDLDNALREIAGELTLGQWDGYCAPHNYRYAYNPNSGLIQIVPSSLDLTFDNLGWSSNPDYYTCNGPILAYCLGNDACAARYDQILLDLADGVENDYAVDEKMDAIWDLVEPYAAAEPRGQYDYGQYVEQFEYVRTYLHELPDRIRDAVAASH